MANKHKVVQEWVEDLINNHTPDEVFFVILGYDVCGWDELTSKHSDYFWSRALKVDSVFELEHHADYQKLLRAVIYTRSKQLSGDEQARSKRLLDEVERTFVESEYNSVDFLERLLTTKHLIVINENVPNELLNLIKLDDKIKADSGNKLHLEEEYRELLEANMSTARSGGVTFINTTNNTRDNCFPRSLILSSGVKVIMRTQPVNAERLWEEKYNKWLGKWIPILPDELAYLQMGNKQPKLIEPKSNDHYIIQDFQKLAGKQDNNASDDDLSPEALSELKDVKIELTIEQLQKLIHDAVNKAKNND